MDVAFAWIHHYDYIAILYCSCWGLSASRFQMNRLVCVCYLSSKGDLSAPLSTAICKEAHQCMNV